jgi:hypothetical protein
MMDWREYIGGRIALAIGEGLSMGLRGHALCEFVRDLASPCRFIAGVESLPLWQQEFHRQLLAALSPDRHPTGGC